MGVVSVTRGRAFSGCRGEEFSREEILVVIHRLVKLLSLEYQAGLAGQGGGRGVETVGKC